MTLTIIILFSVIISACYFGLIIFFTYGWFINKSPVKSQEKPHTRISVIIPFRNEAGNMDILLKSLSEQDFPAELWEVLLVNDHSTDDSHAITKEFIIKNGIKNFRVLALSEADGFSKKAALKKGIENSGGKLIVTTDADCIFKKNWLSALVLFYEQKKCRLISAPVVSDDRKGFFSKLYSFEFLSLVASGAGAMSANQAFLANGANLCFERSLYDELNGYEAHSHYASGDDVFFLLEAKKHLKNKNEICFLKDPESIVTTKGPGSLKEFMNQRIRWASKSTGYKDLFAKFTAASVLLFNLVILVLLICGFIDYWFAVISAIMFAGKLAVDLPLMASATRFIGKPKLILYYFPLQVIYPLYIISVAGLSLFMKFEWKDRKGKGQLSKDLNKCCF